MHIPDGVVSMPVLAGATALAVAGVAFGLRRMRQDDVPRVAVLSSVFFVASLVHVPVGPASVHLMMSGLAGLVLGWTVFPAVLVGLLLQAVLFGFGGVTTLGLNVLNIAFPAFLCHLLFARLMRSTRTGALFGIGLSVGVLAILLSSLMVAAGLALSGPEFLPLTSVVVIAHIPVMAVEGALTGAALVLLARVRPELLRPELLQGENAHV